MEIIRSRLSDKDFFNGDNSYCKMAKKRLKGDIDIQPSCRARRKLFEETLSQTRSYSRTEETVRNLRLSIEGSPVYERYTNIEVFENPPHPYKTVEHSARSMARLEPFQDDTGGETATATCGTLASSSQTVHTRSSSPRTGQTHMQDYFKPKKRPRLSEQQNKTPIVQRHRKSQRVLEEGVSPSGKVV